MTLRFRSLCLMNNVEIVHGVLFHEGLTTREVTNDDANGICLRARSSLTIRVLFTRTCVYRHFRARKVHALQTKVHVHNVCCSFALGRSVPWHIQSMMCSHISVGRAGHGRMIKWKGSLERYMKRRIRQPVYRF